MNEITLKSTRDKIFMAEEAMKNLPAYQIELKVNHYFAHGFYIRELMVPKGVMLVGKIHKFKQFHVITKGDISFNDGNEIKRFKAPSNIISEAGSKRIAYAHEDTIWLMPHKTEDLDLEKIENHFIATSENEYIKFCEDQNRQLVLL